MDYGSIITAAGRRILAGLLAGQTLTLSRIMVGKGNISSVEEMARLTDLVQPVAEATSTVPAVSAEGDSVSFIVEYRSDLNGGLKEGFWLSEFGVFAQNPGRPEEDVLIYYATLGDFPQYVCTYKNGANDIRRYPVTIAIAIGAEVEITYPAHSFMTAEDVQEAITHAGSLGGAYRIGSLSLPVGSWTTLEESKGDYKYQCDVEVEDSRETHYPEAALSVESLPTAEACGLCPTMLAMEGALRFWAKALPKEDMTGTYALFAHGRYTGEGGGSGYTLPAATADLLGGVKVGEGLEVSGDGRLRVVGLAEESIASDVDIRGMVEAGFGAKAGKEKK